MKIIRTVTGDIAPGELGVTQTHEHLYCDQSLCDHKDSFPTASVFMIMKDVDLIVEELGDFHSAGGRAVCEMTLNGWGRDVEVLRKISERSGVKVVAISGFYVEDCHPCYSREASIGEMVDFIVKEVTEGADGTNIRTGMLKSGVGRPVIEGRDRKCAQAVARAQKITGLSITTHTSGSSRFEVRGGNLGEQHLEIFEGEGVDPARVIIGHTDENADIRHLLSLARRGVYIQFDVIGKIHWLLDETRVELLARMAENGYEDHLLLGTDRCRMTEIKAQGGPGYDHLLRNFIPRLHKAGFDEALIRKMLVDNPARVLAFEPK